MAQKLVKRKRKSKGRTAPSSGLAAKVALVENGLARAELPNFSIGDTVKVHVKIRESGKERVQIYEGTVMARQNRGAGKSFRVRKISHGVGVERVFLETSPRLAKVEIVTPGKVRRAKLYYLREREGKQSKVKRDLYRGEDTGAGSDDPVPAKS